MRDEFDSLKEELGEIENLYTKNRAAFELLKSHHPDERVEDGNERMYYQLRDMFNGISKKEYSDALLYYYINKTAYSGMIRYNANGEFNVPYGRYPHLNTKAVTYAHSRLLKRAELFSCDYSKIFDMCDSRDFMFLDPPYDCVFSDYGNETYKDGFNEECHRRLAQDFLNLPCKTLMVIGRTPLTEELYDAYIVDEYKKNYAVNIRNRFKAAATHIVVANYKKSWEGTEVAHASYGSLEPETVQLRLFERRSKYGQINRQ